MQMTPDARSALLALLLLILIVYAILCIFGTAPDCDDAKTAQHPATASETAQFRVLDAPLDIVLDRTSKTPTERSVEALLENDLCARAAGALESTENAVSGEPSARIDHRAEWMEETFTAQSKAVYAAANAARAFDAENPPAATPCAPSDAWTVLAEDALTVSVFHLSRAPDTLSADALEAALQYALKPHAAVFLAAAKLYGVNPLFLAAICAEESGWGRECAAPNNLAGIAVGGEYRAFDSPSACIFSLASLLSAKYRQGAVYYGSSETVAGVALHYNPAHSSVWYAHVSALVNQIAQAAEDAQNAECEATK